MRRPRIGVTVDLDDARAEYRLSRQYADALLAAGGLPVPLPYADAATLGAYVSLCQGIVITGGAFDIAPERYGEARRAACGVAKPDRTAFEWALCSAAFEGRIPVLGVCGGMQLMNVVRGGTLYQDLGQDAGIRAHEQELPAGEPSHAVALVPETLLARLLGPTPLSVNSSHHQAVREPGLGVLVSARSPDGVVEAIELPDLPFALGVQWHPERLFQRDPRQFELWRGLVQAAADVYG